MKKIKLKGRITVNKGDTIACGTQREVFTTDFEEGRKQYVVKVARDRQGVLSNIREYNLYQKLKKNKSKFLKYFPEFKSISKTGRHLLVEKCRVVATDESLYGLDYDSMFPAEIFLDAHDGNFGFTKRNKAVIIDMGYNAWCFNGLLEAFGMKTTLKQLSKL